MINSLLKRLFKAVIVIIIMIIAYSFMGNYLKQHAINTAMNRMKNKQIRGVVFDKFLDSSNHLTKTINIEVESSKYYDITVPLEKSGFFESIQIGDSIFKNNNSLIVIIVRRDTIINYTLKYNNLK